MGDVVPAKHERYIELKIIYYCASWEKDMRHHCFLNVDAVVQCKQGLETCINLQDPVLFNNSLFGLGGDTQWWL